MANELQQMIEEAAEPNIQESANKSAREIKKLFDDELPDYIASVFAAATDRTVDKPKTGIVMPVEVAFEAIVMGIRFGWALRGTETAQQFVAKLAEQDEE